MKAAGFDPLPTYIPPLEDPQTRPDLAARHPLQLISPPRPQFLNSTFANSPRHRTAAGDPTIELSAEDARDTWLDRRPMGRGLQRPRPFSGPGRHSPTACGPASPSPPASTGTSFRREDERQQHHVFRLDRHGRAARRFLITWWRCGRYEPSSSLCTRWPHQKSSRPTTTLELE